MADTQQLEQFFAHYGVKGMRWGIRKDRPGGSGLSTPNDPSTMSDAELQARLHRMRMEKSYRELQGSPSSIRGQQYVQTRLNTTTATIKSVAAFSAAVVPIALKVAAFYRAWNSSWVGTSLSGLS
jgi:hypothetical protein